MGLFACIPDYIRLQGSIYPHPWWSDLFILHGYFDSIENVYFNGWLAQSRFGALMIAIAIFCLWIYHERMEKR